MDVYKLKFTSPLHLGAVKPIVTTGNTQTEDSSTEYLEEKLHSDTLFGAIMFNWNLLFKDNMSDLIKNPQFVVSSAFPYIENELFFPLPLGALDDILSDESKKFDIKKIKKISYFPKELFLKCIQSNGKLKLSDFNEYSKQFEIKNPVYGEEMSHPRISIDRLNSMSLNNGFFYSSDFYFKDNCGFYFLVNFKDKNIINKFEAALRLLGDNGIGGDRTIGRGQFTFTKERIELKFAQKNKGFVLLSLYLPSEDDLNKKIMDNCSYSIITREGYIGKPGIHIGLKRKTIRMFAEGSVFKNGDWSDGIVENVYSKDEVNIFRNGQKFGIEIGG